MLSKGFLGCSVLVFRARFAWLPCEQSTKKNTETDWLQPIETDWTRLKPTATEAFNTRRHRHSFRIQSLDSKILFTEQWRRPPASVPTVHRTGTDLVPNKAKRKIQATRSPLGFHWVSDLQHWKIIWLAIGSRFVNKFKILKFPNPWAFERLEVGGSNSAFPLRVSTQRALASLPTSTRIRVATASKWRIEDKLWPPGRRLSFRAS